MNSLEWANRTDSQDSAAKTPSEVKYTCPVCGANAWAKPDAVLYCGASRHLHQMRAEGETVAEPEDTDQ
jgi:hypothetical protein